MTQPGTQDKPKAYLGDAVYAEIVDGRLQLTTEDGYRATNIIVLERDVWRMLQHYMERHGAKLTAW